MFLKRKTIKFLLISAVLSVMALTATACSGDNKGFEKNEMVQPNPTSGVVHTETKENFDSRIITANGVIYYPEYITEYLYTEVAESDHSTVAFYAVIGEHEKTALFDINLYAAEHTVNMYESDIDDTWTEEETDILYSMQESINEIVVELSDVVTAISIDTPYGTLKYPGKWEEYVIISVNEGTDCTVNVGANIDGEKVELFSVILGDEKSDSVGTIKDKDGNEVFISVIMNELEDKYTEDSNLLYSMQEDINVLLDSLNML